MSVISSPVAGSPSTGLTSPSFTLVRDYSAEPNVEAYYVSALSGCPSVDVHSINNPFQISFYIPKSLKYMTSALGVASGLIAAMPRNTYGFTVRKGTAINTINGRGIAFAKGTVDVPTNSEAQDEISVRAMLSLLGGAIHGNSDSVIAAVKTGSLP